MAPPNPFIPFAPHHIYIGLFLILLSVLMLPQLRDYKPYIYIVFIVGLFLVLDDFIEHTLTANTPMRHLFSLLSGHGINHRDHLVTLFFRYPKG